MKKSNGEPINARSMPYSTGEIPSVKMRPIMRQSIAGVHRHALHREG